MTENAGPVVETGDPAEDDETPGLDDTASPDHDDTVSPDPDDDILPGADEDAALPELEDGVDTSDLCGARSSTLESDDELDRVLEALLLVVDTPISVAGLAGVTEVPEHRIAARLVELAAGYTERDSGIDLREAGGGWRMYTRARFAPYVERLLLDGARSKLTRAALETLAVIAFRQPVTRARVSAVRGVNVDAVIRTLAARGLIVEAGPDPDSGAATFTTTELFLERLGLTSLAELPDIAPLLPDVDVIDDLSENLESEPRFMKLNSPGTAGSDAGPLPNFELDQET